MEAFFFGPPERRLFGVYHPASLARDRGVGVVLCHPMGQEHIRSHRAFLQVATQLAAAGFHTLRFDFSGSGDSALEFEACGLDAWEEDLRRALDELVAGTGVERLCALGVRLGAALAARAVLPTRECSCVDTLVLWNPTVSGAAYLADIEAQHREYFEGSFARSDPASGQVESLGFTLSPALLADLRALDLATLEAADLPRRHVLLVDTEPDGAGDPALEHLAERLRRGGVALELLRVAAPPVWCRSRDDELGSVAVPVAVLDELVRRLVEHCG